jgi:hypothetical protein
VNTGFGSWAPNHADCLAGTFTGSSVGLSALPANGQTAQMADASIALNALQPLEVHADFTAKISFNDVFAVLNGVNDLGELLLSEILGANTGINFRAGQHFLRVGRADAVDVTQGDVDPFIGRDFYSDDACHMLVKWK